jgi:hypothetical protein
MAAANNASLRIRPVSTRKCALACSLWGTASARSAAAQAHQLENFGTSPINSPFNAGFYEMQPVQQQYAQQMQQQHLAASSSSSQGPQHVPGGSGGYPGQSSAYNSTMMHDRANLGGEFAPLEVSGVLQFSNGILGPQAAGAGNWQPPPPQHMSYASPFTPAPNPTPYLRQGVPSSLGNSNARISQRLELPPLPRPLSSAAVVADAQPDTAAEFKPAV